MVSLRHRGRLFQGFWSLWARFSAFIFTYTPIQFRRVSSACNLNLSTMYVLMKHKLILHHYIPLSWARATQFDRRTLLFFRNTNGTLRYDSLENGLAPFIPPQLKLSDWLIWQPRRWPSAKNTMSVCPHLCAPINSLQRLDFGHGTNGRDDQYRVPAAKLLLKFGKIIFTSVSYFTVRLILTYSDYWIITDNWLMTDNRLFDSGTTEIVWYLATRSFNFPGVMPLGVPSVCQLGLLTTQRPGAGCFAISY